MTSEFSDDGERDQRRMVRNPKTGKREDVNSLPTTGYKRAYLELLAEFEEWKGRLQNAVELEGTLNFEKDKWDLGETESAYRLCQTEREDKQVMELVAWKHASHFDPDPDPVFSEEDSRNNRSVAPDSEQEGGSE